MCPDEGVDEECGKKSECQAEKTGCAKTRWERETGTPRKLQILQQDKSLGWRWVRPEAIGLDNPTQ